ncbi:NAD(P)/FAD-dependent oxidoreductase [Aurantiacibacter rhizosphaerae]|uniref:NAD(P)-binding protein n=1 Tax=Aurantiacibacter rhizosphaerae TaxID=2691582 RepID=A0A844XF84_9SPHN|nr:NAD(P)-binding protein [Aurantiacibacter rhizosphaerae]MWV28322.1 NAD(P)-binding protein [Aurantiacibacter rhizosphaerae]
MTLPLILGAGPAGCAAAIRLAQGGKDVTLLDKDETVGDPLCGGFLSWRTAEQLQRLGVDIHAAGAHRVRRLRLFDGKRRASLDLPHVAYGLSRHALDSAMRTVAMGHGVNMVFDEIRGLSEGAAHGKARDWQSSAIFHATGKHDIRGQSRPRNAKDTALGIRLRLPASPERTRLLEGAIELHLFKGGYVGIVLQEGGSANICLAMRKSALAEAGGLPEKLFATLARDNPALAARLGDDWREACPDTIGAVPYGWICDTTSPGLYRLGDQAAVIPSLAGEGISIALASGVCAAEHYCQGHSAHDYQRNFAKKARKPVRLARLAWHLAETQMGARAAIALAGIAPSAIAVFADLARIEAPPSLAPR